MDIAARAYNHTFRTDPIVRSLLDTDIYKLIMLPVIEKYYATSEVEFTLICRSPEARLSTIIDKGEIAEQLDEARTVSLARRERIWLAGNTFYGQDRMFDEKLLEWLENYRLPDYEIEYEGDELVLRFKGSYADVTLWEIPALAIVSELRARYVLRQFGRMKLDVLYARAKAKLWEKIERLRRIEGLRIADFGTRRRHSFLWQRWCIEAMMEGLDQEQFIGTSNLLHAMERDLEAIGTNAHELPMVEATLCRSDEDLKESRYRVLDQWAASYRKNLLILLPDTFGTTSFLKNAPERFASWTGARVDSKDPVEGGEELIRWWEKCGENAKEKMLIFSDGLDVETIERCSKRFSGRVRVGFGWGTNLTNDFSGCATRKMDALEPISIVCKVTQVNGRPAVKLSDNPGKAIGPISEVNRYYRVFGRDGMREQSVTV